MDPDPAPFSFFVHPDPPAPNLVPFRLLPCKLSRGSQRKLASPPNWEPETEYFPDGFFYLSNVYICGLFIEEMFSCESIVLGNIGSSFSGSASLALPLSHENLATSPLKISQILWFD